MNEGERRFADVYFRTATGTNHSVTFANLGALPPDGVPLYGVPSSLTVAGDLHRLEVFAIDDDGAPRGVWQFYRNPADRTVTLGAALGVPNISTVADSPYVRLRAVLPVQADYPSLGRAAFSQRRSNASVHFIVAETEGFRVAARADWVLEIPDLSAAGFPAAARVAHGSARRGHR